MQSVLMEEAGPTKVTYSEEDANTAAVSIGEALSKDYDIIVESLTLDGAGTCTRIDASEAKGGKGTPDQLQAVYIIPAGEGSIIAEAHYAFEAAEGFGHRFHDLVHTIVVLNDQD
ncbi:MAG: hypothetical protein J5859_03630 [Clostridia bacterium]|nr:hypothetical protein [Clostridia bacterium]